MKRTITRDEWSTLILLLAILFGTFIRFNPTMLAGFAVNDGGMFTVMIDDLRSNHYLLPEFTTYNFLDFPFAYPPLGFYFGALVADILGMDATQVVRWLPALFASLSIPAFYILAVWILKNKYLASLSALMFALLPRAFSWFIMGGGLTRALGQFFMLLALGVIVRLYEEGRRKDVLLMGLFSGLAILSHPEAGVHTFFSAILIWLVVSRRRDTFVQSVIVGLIVLVVTAPWWGTVIFYHGIEHLLNAARTGGNTLAVFHLIFLTFAEEPYVTFITVLGVIGLVRRFILGRYLLPLWMIFPFLLVGRSATALAVVPLAMLAAVGLGDVLLPALQMSVKRDAEHEGRIGPMERNITLCLILYLAFSAYQFGFQFSSASLNESDLDAMTWVKTNTPEGSRFLVLTGTTSVACDSVLEWFPALADRQSVFTIQGHEWTLGDGFGSFISHVVEVQACVEDELSCLDENTGLGDYDYVFLERRSLVDNCTPLDFSRDFRYFFEQMVMDDRYNMVYENDGVAIFDNR